ncbi:hypothetical protein IFR05_005399 [Cadophora sp. M221]|nr:hypothetical protein IFR05_005399 [Cadophora sp. M221]
MSPRKISRRDDISARDVKASEEDLIRGKDASSDMSDSARSDICQVFSRDPESLGLGLGRIGIDALQQQPSAGAFLKSHQSFQESQRAVQRSRASPSDAQAAAKHFSRSLKEPSCVPVPHPRIAPSHDE